MLARILSAILLAASATLRGDGQTALCLKLDEGQGLPLDSSPNKLAPVSFGAKWTAGRMAGGHALDFDGTQKGANLIYPSGKALDICSAPFTMELWLCPRLEGKVKGYGKDGKGTWYTLVARQSDWKKGFQVIMIDDNLRFQVFKNMRVYDSWELALGLREHLGKWTHLAFVFDPDNKAMAIYINGLQQAHLPVDGLGCDADVPLLIGGFRQGWAFDGKLAELVISGRAKSAAEIRVSSGLARSEQDKLDSL